MGKLSGLYRVTIERYTEENKRLPFEDIVADQNITDIAKRFDKTPEEVARDAIRVHQEGWRHMKAAASSSIYERNTPK